MIPVQGPIYWISICLRATGSRYRALQVRRRHGRIDWYERDGQGALLNKREDANSFPSKGEIMASDMCARPRLSSN